MVANYEIKRNALSARWGVWSSEQESDAPVENLLAEFKSQDQAETFKERVAAGQSPDEIIAEINAKPVSEKSEGGLFGKFFKRGAKTEVTATTTQMSNPVIQIQAVQKVDDELSAPNKDEISLASTDGVEAVQRKPMIRYEDDSPARPQFTPQPEASSATGPIEHEVRAEKLDVPESTGAPDQESSAIPAASVEPQTAFVETSPLQEDAIEINESALKMASHVESPAPDAPALKMPEFSAGPVEQSEPKAESEESRRQGMLNWTFTPPPDVSAAEVQSGVAPTVPVESKSQAAPTMDFREVHGTKIAVESARFEALRSDSAGGGDISDKKYNSIASKEYTEVSKAFASRNSQGTLHDELLHLATVCMAWADAIEKRMASGTSERAA